MPRVSAPAWRAPSVGARTCVEGGYLRQARPIYTEVFRGDGGRDGVFTSVGKTEGWLAEAVTGKHVSTRCLHRTSIFEDMRAKALHEKYRVADRMSDLAYEDDSAMPCETPRRKKRRDEAGGAAREQAPLSPEKVSGTPVCICMKSVASADVESVDVSVVLRRKKLFLSVAALPWLLGYLQAELEDGVVIAEDVQEEEKEAEHKVWWDFRDSTWVARRRLPSGECVWKRGPITARMRDAEDVLYGMSREDAKRAVYEELRAWLQGGEVQEASPAAAADAAYSSM